MILDHAPVEVIVWPVVDVDNGYGGLKPGEGEPFTIHAFAQPLEALGPAEGWHDPGRFKLMFHPAPAHRWGRVRFDGEDYSVVDHPKLHAATPSTTFMTAIVSRRQGVNTDGQGEPPPQ